MLEQISTELSERERRVLEGHPSDSDTTRDAELSDREASLATSMLELERQREQLAALEQTTMERSARVEIAQARLDERTAELARVADELNAREVELARLEHTTRERAGQADLAQARLDERATELASVAETLDTRELELEAQLPPPPTEVEPEQTHLLFVGGDRYRLLPGDGPAPAPGSEITLDGTAYRVVGIRASPLPGDPRRCALLEPRPPADSETEIPVE